MTTFDSDRVVVTLPPCEIEAMLDDYCSHSGRLNRAEAVQVVLAYADHARVCGLLAGILERVARAWHPVFAQVTQYEPRDVESFCVDALPELVRRFDVAGATLEVVR